MVSEGPPSRCFSESGRYDADGARSKGRCMSVPWRPESRWRNGRRRRELS